MTEVNEDEDPVGVGRPINCCVAGGPMDASEATDDELLLPCVLAGGVITTVCSSFVLFLNNVFFGLTSLASFAGFAVFAALSESDLREKRRRIVGCVESSEWVDVVLLLASAAAVTTIEGGSCAEQSWVLDSSW